MANEYLDLIKRVNEAIKPEKGLRIAVTTVLAVHKERIFTKGLDANGNKIGTYGNNPISISPKNQARQTGKTYFKGGYAEYKRDVGKNPGFVILRNTDQMMMDYQMIVNGTQVGIGFQNDHNSDKADWMTAKYGKKIFANSQSELDLLTTILNDQIKRI